MIPCLVASQLHVSGPRDAVGHLKEVHQFLHCPTLLQCQALSGGPAGSTEGTEFAMWSWSANHEAKHRKFTWNQIDVWVNSAMRIIPSWLWFGFAKWETVVRGFAQMMLHSSLRLVRVAGAREWVTPKKWLRMFASLNMFKPPNCWMFSNLATCNNDRNNKDVEGGSYPWASFSSQVFCDCSGPRQACGQHQSVVDPAGQIQPERWERRCHDMRSQAANRSF